jgi:hypothetical protein
MPYLPEVILTLLTAFQGKFTKPTWKYASILLIGAILCKGKRTITSILCVMGLSKEKRFERYHRVLNRAAWSTFSVSKILLGLLITILPINNIIIAMDETIERRRGDKITAKGCYRDSCRSTHKLVIKCFGLKWQCATLLIKMPWANRHWALPFMTVLCTSKAHDKDANKTHKTSIDYAMQMVKIISNWFKKKPWILLGDGGFACIKLGLTCVAHNTTLISRLRLDAALYNTPPVRTENTKGRPRVKGSRAVSLKEIAKSKDTTWEECEVAWYKGVSKKVKICTGVNLWYKSGNKPLEVRWVLVMDIESQKVQAFFSTNISLSAHEIVEYFVLRWNIEVTFEEVRAHLGVETQRQWSKNAIGRSTPVLMGLFSLVCLMAYKLLNGSPLQTVSSAWYKKDSHATFSDVLFYVKQAITMNSYFKTLEINDEFVKISRNNWDDLVDKWLMAA